jgi:CBS domain-containing protein
MRASDLARAVPTVTRRTSALDAARLIAEHGLAGLNVADDQGVPVAVVPGTQVLKLVVPRFVREDASLAHVYDEAGAQELCAELGRKSVGDLLDSDEVETRELPSVSPDDTLIEIAAVMIERHAPVIVVRDRNGTYAGSITFAAAMAAIAEIAVGQRPTGTV